MIVYKFTYIAKITLIKGIITLTIYMLRFFISVLNNACQLMDLIVILQ